MRERDDFVTPITPFSPGDEPWCVFSQRGSYEFMCHPTDAERLVAEGIVIDGVRLECRVIERWPYIGAYHVHAMDITVNTTWIR